MSKVYFWKKIGKRKIVMDWKTLIETVNIATKWFLSNEK